MKNAAVYRVHCRTTTLARMLAGDFRTVSGFSECYSPPFCLRLRPAFRTPAACAFRAAVAREAWASRHAAP